jgi:GNAT superfamily N-acetyltransferase
MEVTIRRAQAADAEACGHIIFEAFKDISDRHRFPWDFPSIEAGVQFATTFINHPLIFGVVAEYENKIVGSNFLDERDPIRGVGPITIDPSVQQRGIGRRLMQAVVERGKGSLGIRLLQDSFNMRSVSLYASLGFDVKESVLFMTGKPKSKQTPEVEVRPLVEGDINSCADLCKKVHGFDRANELRDALKYFAPYVASEQGRIIAYATAPTFWALNHGVAESEVAMKALLIGAAAANSDPLNFLLPTRQSTLFRWCLSEGLKAVKPMTLMAMGSYQEPKGAYYPSVLY